METDTNEVQQIASDVREIKEAVLGNNRIGLNGLVADVRSLKQWRAKIDLRVAGIAGGVSAFVLLIKFIFSFKS